MSTIKTNTLTGTTSAGSILVTGEGGSTTLNLQNALTKSFTRVNATQDSLQVSHNVSGITDVATGRTTSTFTNPMNSATFVTIGASVTSVDRNSTTSTLATTGYDTRCFTQAGAASDTAQCSCAMGDLA